MTEHATDYHPEKAEESVDTAATGAVVQVAIDAAKRFIGENADALSAIMGAGGVSIQIGQGWATDLTTGKVTVDPTFFIEHDYRPDWVNYGMMHEISAHLVPMIKEPGTVKERIAWVGDDDAKHLFLNILEDIAGNRRMHSLLPRQAEVAAEVYSEKQFPEVDYTSFPKHLQLMYKMIREEMIPNSQTIVEPEVDAALESLRRGKFGDIIKQSTARFKPRTHQELPRELQFRIWLDHIYPIFESLLEQDRQDPRFRSTSGEPGEPGENGESGGKPYDFGQYYDDYEQNRHPEPMSHEEAEKTLDKALEKEREAARQKKEDDPQKQAERKAGDRIQSEIGEHTLREYRAYRRELIALAAPIDEMRQFFSTLLDERVVSVRRLNKAGEEGAVLNPNTLAQTVADIRAGRPNPPAFLDYGRAEKERQAEGHFDCYLVVDNSGSMDGDRIQQARRASMVFLEGLSAFEREIRAREVQGGIQLDWDVRTSVHTFGEEATQVKPLSHTLSETQRLDVVGDLDASSGGTNDYLALRQIAESIRAEIAGNHSTRNRRRIVIVITDGDSSNPTALGAAVAELTALGVSVVAIGIQTTSVEEYYPVGRSIQDVKDLTKALSGLIESEIAR